jgi:aryl-alcohol dehydrogenase-like predicted oxidoreductase
MTFAADHGFSLPQLGIAWCLKNENVSTVILGATKSSQLKETLKSAELVSKLTPEIMHDIEAILQNKPQHPQY